MLPWAKSQTESCSAKWEGRFNAAGRGSDDSGKVGDAVRCSGSEVWRCLLAGVGGTCEWSRLRPQNAWRLGAQRWSHFPPQPANCTCERGRGARAGASRLRFSQRAFGALQLSFGRASPPRRSIASEICLSSSGNAGACSGKAKSRWLQRLGSRAKVGLANGEGLRAWSPLRCRRRSRRLLA